MFTEFTECYRNISNIKANDGQIMRNQAKKWI